MKLTKINLSSKPDKDKFINFPFTIYKDHPYWVPPLKAEIERVLSPSKHPFYRHSNADFFVVESEREVLGRIAILQNKNFNAYHNSKTAFFYYFDTVDDAGVAKLLIDAAKDWAKKEGLTQIMGPKGFLRSSGIGLLVEGFEILPAMGLAYNYPYYATHLENNGFVKATDHLSGFMDHSHTIPEKIHEAAEKVKKRGNFWVQEFTNSADIRKRIHAVEEVHRKAFSKNPNFMPSTSQEFELMAGSIIQIAEPGLIKLIMKGDEVAGFIIAYPNVNRAIQQIKGRLWPLGWWKVLRAKKKTKLCDLNGLGIIPEHQGAGANLLLYNELEKTLRKYHFERVELVQIDEQNFKSKSDMENMGVIWHKRHRTYKLDIQ